MLIRAALDPVERARRSLLDFTNLTFPQYVAEPAHVLLARNLDRVVRGEIKRLMVFAPPQHGKSELVSVRLPAYWLGRRPDAPVILASYAASLAESKSRHARSIVESLEYQQVFPGVGTRKDSRAVNRWELAAPARGSMLAVGVGGPVTGHGALLGVIDDPIENWEQGQSQTIRDRIWDWWQGTFRTRIWESGAIVLIMTRWHEDDLAGRLLLDQVSRWTVLRLPALAEGQEERNENNRHLGLMAGDPDPLGRVAGEALCPRRFSERALSEIRRDVGSRVWWAEYQGVPRAMEGNRFKRVWFQVVDAVLSEVKRVRYWDKAGTESGGTYTCGVLMARDESGIFYVEDVVRGQWSALEREAMMLQTAEIDSRRGKVIIWQEQEPGSGGKESAEATVRNLAGYPIHSERVTGSKEVRAEPFAAQAEAGNVKLVRGVWNGAYLDEVSAFPQGRYKDQVDASSGALNKLTRAPIPLPELGAQPGVGVPGRWTGQAGRAAGRRFGGK